MNAIARISFLLFGLILSAQTYPDLSGMTFNEIQAIADWNILVQAEGKLDNDQLKDMVIILESKDSIPEIRCEGCKKQPNKARIIAVPLSGDSKLKVSIQNNRFIARSNEGGKIRRLVPEINITNKRLRIFYQYVGSSSMEYIFELRNKELVLVHAKHLADHDRKVIETKEYDFINGSLTIVKMNLIDQRTGSVPEELLAKEVKDISNHKMKRLIDFKEMYSWEITKYHKL